MGYSGYKKIFVGKDYPGADNRGFVPEHRYVVEQKLGRPLKKGEVCHHCDRNRLNNTPENLLVFVDKESHSRYHQGGTLIELPDGTYTSEFPKVNCICEYCGKEYEPKDRKTKYCSKECAMLASRKVQRPSKAELKALLLQFSMTDIARIYGVTDNAIRRWCEMYKLPQRLKGIKALREKEAAKALEKQRNEEAKQRQKAARKLQKQREKLK